MRRSITNPARRASPRNYLARKEQWRLLAMVFALGLVFMLIGLINGPRGHAVLNLFFGSKGDSAATHDEPNVSNDEIARLIQGSNRDVTPRDAFRSSGDPYASSTPTNGRESSPASADDVFPGVDSTLLSAIEDNTMYRAAETPAWSNFFQAIMSACDAGVAERSLGPITYAQLVRQPDAYRGEVITIRGQARQVVAVKPTMRIAGVDEYFRIVIQPSGGDRKPMIAYCASLPNGFPRDGDVHEDVRIDGLFFKNWSYAAGERFQLAPVVLARGLNWTPRSPIGASAGDANSGGVFVACVVVAGALASLATFGVWRRTRGQRALLSCALVFILNVTANITAAKDDPPSSPESMKEYLEVAGIELEQWSALRDGAPLDEDELALAWKILYRLRRLSPERIAGWSIGSANVGALVGDPQGARAKVETVRGRAVRAERKTLPPEDAARFEMAEYYVIEVAVEDTKSAVVLIAAEAPASWVGVDQLDERCEAEAVFFKMGETSGGSPVATFLTRRVRWNADDQGTLPVNPGALLLGEHGFDLGLASGVKNSATLLASESEPFYEMLRSAGAFSARELDRIAMDQLDAYANGWRERAEIGAGTNPQSLEQRVAAEVTRLAESNRYSVAPLFTDARNQFGELFSLEGIARRAVRISTDASRGGDDAAADHLGFDHYFEVELFTPDSQNLPIVFCLRELPDGFPTGEEISEDVRIPGFFFKKWRYRSRRAAIDGAPSQPESTALQSTPLLIGPGLLRIEDQAPTWSTTMGAVFAVLFLLSIAVIVWLQRSYSKGDRAFARNVIRPPRDAVEQLDDTRIDIQQTPDFRNLDPPTK